MNNQESGFIVVKNVKHSYQGGKLALDDICLDIGVGLVGLLGANGAGKSTLMRIICTLLEPTSGEVSVGGYDVVNQRQYVRKMLGYLPQEFGAWRLKRVQEVLDILASLSGMKDKRSRKQRIEEMLELVGLTDVANRKVNNLSGGMLRRLGVAQALVHDPKVIIMDEPTIGLDPEERLRFRKLMADLSRDRVILLSTHIVADLGSSCSNLILIDNGKIEFKGSPAELITQAEGKVVELEVAQGSKEELELQETLEVVTRRSYNGKSTFRGVLRSGDIPNGSNTAQNITLEEAYLAYTLNQGREMPDKTHVN